MFPVLSLRSAATLVCSVAAVKSVACRGQMLMHVIPTGFGEAKLFSPKTEHIRPGIETVVARRVSVAGAVTRHAGSVRLTHLTLSCGEAPRACGPSGTPLARN